MERISSDKEEARASMNWENRLKKARAQREAILRERAAEQPGGNGLQPISIVEMAEKLRYGSVGEPTQPKASKGSQAPAADTAAAKDANPKPGTGLKNPVRPDAARKPFDGPSDTPSFVKALRSIEETRAKDSSAAPSVALPPIPPTPASTSAVTPAPVAPSTVPPSPVAPPPASPSPVSPSPLEVKAPLDIPVAPFTPTVEPKAPQPATQMTPLPVLPDTAKRPAWKRTLHIGAGFCIGIGVGFGAMTYVQQNGFPDLGLGTLIQTTTAPLAQEPLVVSDLGVATVPPEGLSAPVRLLVGNEGPGELMAFASLTASPLAALPEPGQPPRLSLLVPVPPNMRDVPILLDTAPALAAQTGAGTELNTQQLAALGRSPSDVPISEFPFDTTSPSQAVALSVIPRPRPAQPVAEPPSVLASLNPTLSDAPSGVSPDIRLASLEDGFPALNGPSALTGTPDPGVAPLASEPPAPAPQQTAPAAIAGAEEMLLWIIAAGTASNDAVTSAQGVAEGLNLFVRDVNRVNYVISQNQIRYYDASTAEAAERLGAAIGARVRDFTSSGVNAAPGTLEIYLAGQPLPGTRTSTPSRAPRQSEEDILRANVLSKLRSGITQ